MYMSFHHDWSTIAPYKHVLCQGELENYLQHLPRLHENRNWDLDTAQAPTTFSFIHMPTDDESRIHLSTELAQ